ncbi:glutamate-1-semialdehyde 2,1-aminomutase [Pseudoxanthobacter soli DSM 19599]|uniref:Glutamate-1-semialdehyde 2,1-aminomutase n=1 Tax=Pseudoxanthobacter soli DSM 19599 TaxID=1123029 RepID=A0A1M7ZKZ0_9HYPH|nr:transaminase [Pseudoxanthobacter soli]SHO65570.1 glutamate-1-semialdehyde 2,1-aminomutase [Pseudoxanthobacter soli DSM 19599]
MSSQPDSSASSFRAFESAAAALYAREAAVYAERRPRSSAACRDHGAGFVSNVPLHWMLDWPMPFPMVVAEAQGVHIADIDGNRLTDFCLGDTGAMFGHAPPPVVRALAGLATRGFTFMLPSADAFAAGDLLAARFGLPHWQVATTASDANRFAIRAARAVTRRPKVLVFDGCYHGTVEDTLVDLVDGRTIARRSLIGQVADLSQTTVAIPFNDVDALRQALAAGDVACIIAEPVMTNCSMILPEPGFHEALRALTRAAGTLLLIDETHTLSTGPGGYTRVHGLEPDLMVMGKPIAGGVPAAVWGMTAAVAEAFAAARDRDEHGHSGIGTTLSGSALQLACLRACLEEVMTEEAYAAMLDRAAEIEAGLASVIRSFGLPWHVARVGARLEVVFRSAPLRNAAEARAAAMPETERALHMMLLNRGFLLTPFHNMVLVGPGVTNAEAAAFVAAFADAVAELSSSAEAIQ